MVKVGYLWEKPLFCAIFLIILISGCAANSKSVKDLERHDPFRINTPVGTKLMDEEEVQRILETIETRNRTVEESEEWIKRSYAGLMVRRLSGLSSSEYEKYREYLDDDDSVYIIVHPAFFPFFHYPKKLVDNTSETISTSNVVEEFLSKEPKDFEYAMLQAQERRMRDFIEFKSTQEKLIIVVVPRNYTTYSGYTYKRGRDEYMRYMNEITNFSKSVLFAESRSPNRGYLTEEDAIRLMEFLISMKVKTIYVGGGYIGRCLEDFYTLLTEEYGSEGIYVVPELSDISPRELNDSLAKALLKLDGDISIELATNIMQRDVYRIQEIKPYLKNLK